MVIYKHEQKPFVSRLVSGIFHPAILFLFSLTLVISYFAIENRAEQNAPAWYTLGAVLVLVTIFAFRGMIREAATPIERIEVTENGLKIQQMKFDTRVETIISKTNLSVELKESKRSKKEKIHGVERDITIRSYKLQVMDKIVNNLPIEVDLERSILAKILTELEQAGFIKLHPDQVNFIQMVNSQVNQKASEKPITALRYIPIAFLLFLIVDLFILDSRYSSKLMEIFKDSDQLNFTEEILVDSVTSEKMLDLKERFNQLGYTEVLNFEEGLVAVKNESGWGFADSNGNIVIPCQYHAVSSFQGGKAVVQTATNNDDWLVGHYYIDLTGKKLGSFYDAIESAGETGCIEVKLVGSNEEGERYAEYNISNCLDGKKTYTYQGWEWGNQIEFYPDTDISVLIKDLAQRQNEFASIFQKFTGSSANYQDGDYTIDISVSKSDDGSFQAITISRHSDYEGVSLSLTVKDKGVLITKDHGS